MNGSRGPGAATRIQPEGVDPTGPTGSGKWDRDDAERALDELFSLASTYRSSHQYHSLLKFVARFRHYAPLNALLVRTQKPGATYVASPRRWLDNYRRRPKPNGQPLVILQPRGPVMFVFDVSDVEPVDGNAPPLPDHVVNPFPAYGGLKRGELELVMRNAKLDGVRTTMAPLGSQAGGSIRAVQTGATQSVTVGARKPQRVIVPIRYDLVVNSNHGIEGRYATVVHELAHLYCGHLGTPNKRWWPDRHSVEHDVKELEAESVAYLVCLRAGIHCHSERYLSGYVRRNEQTARISLDRVMVAGGLIESMSRGQRRPRKSDA